MFTCTHWKISFKHDQAFICKDKKIILNHEQTFNHKQYKSIPSSLCLDFVAKKVSEISQQQLIFKPVKKVCPQTFDFVAAKKFQKEPLWALRTFHKHFVHKQWKHSFSLCIDYVPGENFLRKGSTTMGLTISLTILNYAFVVNCFYTPSLC